MNAGCVEQTEVLTHLIGIIFLADRIEKNPKNMGLWLICATINAIFSDHIRPTKTMKQHFCYTNTDRR